MLITILFEYDGKNVSEKACLIETFMSLLYEIMLLLFTTYFKISMQDVFK